MLGLAGGTKKNQRQRSRSAAEKIAQQSSELAGLHALVESIADEYDIYSFDEAQNAALRFQAELNAVGHLSIPPDMTDDIIAARGMLGDATRGSACEHLEMCARGRQDDEVCNR